MVKPHIAHKKTWFIPIIEKRVNEARADGVACHIKVYLPIQRIVYKEPVFLTQLLIKLYSAKFR